jgi:hypothetical protein
MWIAETAIVVDRHIIAGISVARIICDVMGGLSWPMTCSEATMGRCVL